MSRPMDKMSGPQEEMEEGPEDQAMEESGQMLSEEDEADIDIAIAAALKMIDTPEGEQQLQQIMQQKDPAALLSVFLAKMIEAVMTGEGGDEITPAVWFAEGGVLDDMAGELSDIAGADIESMMPQLKQMTLEKVKKMAEVFKQQGAPQDQAQGQPAPRQPPPILGG